MKLAHESISFTDPRCEATRLVYPMYVLGLVFAKHIKKEIVFSTKVLKWHALIYCFSGSNQIIVEFVGGDHVLINF